MALRAVAYWLAFTVYGYMMAALEARLLGRPALFAGFCAAAIALLGGLAVVRRHLIDAGLELVFEESEPAICTLDLKVPRPVIVAAMRCDTAAVPPA